MARQLPSINPDQPMGLGSDMFDPTEDQRRMVRAMAGFGIPQEDIAKHLRIDPKTLRKHLREELDRGTVEANVKVAQSLFQMATQGKNVAAAIFWMKARAGWREKHEISVSAAPIKDLSDAELMQVIEVSRHAIEEEEAERAVEQTESTS